VELADARRPFWGAPAEAQAKRMIVGYALTRQSGLRIDVSPLDCGLHRSNAPPRVDPGIAVSAVIYLAQAFGISTAKVCIIGLNVSSTNLTSSWARQSLATLSAS
jgi:hypothetical protein